MFLGRTWSRWSLADALKTARDEGAMEADRIADAAANANEKGLLTDEESSQFQG